MTLECVRCVVKAKFIFCPIHGRLQVDAHLKKTNAAKTIPYVSHGSLTELINPVL